MANPKGIPDRNVRSFCDDWEPEVVHIHGDLGPIIDEDPQSRTFGQIISADTLKFSNAQHKEVHIHGNLIGSGEDCVDFNRRSRNNKVIVHGLIIPRGAYIVTHKGAASDNSLTGTVRGHGTVVDLDFGNVADQSDNVSGPFTAHLKHETGEAITYRVLGSVDPQLGPPEQRFECVLSLPRWARGLFLKGYKFLKNCGLPI